MDGAGIDGRADGEMPSAGGPGSGVITDQADAHDVKDELFKLERWLKALVDTYEERPSAIDRAVSDAAGHAIDVRAAITAAFRTMKNQVFTEESPLRTDNDLWEAFKEQQDEFTAFYRSALNAVETHKELLQHYDVVKEEARLHPQHGDLERMRQDRRAYVEERDECITAVNYFFGKFSAMLTDLRN
jgi:hypothetical protein